MRIVVTVNKPKWVDRLGPKGHGETTTGHASPAVKAGRALPHRPRCIPISTPANSETLRSTSNRVQERSNYQSALHIGSVE